MFYSCYYGVFNLLNQVLFVGKVSDFKRFVHTKLNMNANPHWKGPILKHFPGVIDRNWNNQSRRNFFN